MGFLSSTLTEDATGRCRGAKAARLGSCLELDIVDTVAGKVFIGFFLILSTFELLC